MPLVTNLIDDKSPLIHYDSTWLPGNSWDDVDADQYYLGTFTTNNVTNGQASFSFNGTGIWLYGAKRPNHANYYYVQLDDGTFGPYNGVPTSEAFMQPIFNDSGFAQKIHTVTLTNEGTDGTYVDIDLIVWQSEVGNADQQLITETVQDTDPRFQYQHSAWSSSPSDSNFYSNGTGHYTEVEGATVTLSFIVGGTVASAWSWDNSTYFSGCVSSVKYSVTLKAVDKSGEMVTLFGATGTSNGPYSVQLDGGETTQYNGTTFLPFYGVTLFHADNLGFGQHNLTLTNAPSVTGQQLSIDYALVSTLSDNTSSGGTSYQLSTGGIVGIAVCGTIAVFASILAFSLWRKLKAVEALKNQLYVIGTTQGPPETSVAFSTSLETRRASLVRHDASWAPEVNRRSLDAVPEGATHFPSSGPPGLFNESSGGPLPEIPGQRGSPPTSTRKRGARTQPTQNTDTAEPPSPIRTEPPNYSEIIEADMA